MKAERGKRARGSILLSGWIFLFIMLLLLGAAWNTGTNLLFIVLGGIFSFVALSVVLSSWNLRRLTLHCEAAAAVHRDESFLAALRIENHKLLVPAISIRAESALHRGEALGYVIKIPARRAALLNVPLVFRQRGVHRLPEFYLATSFPFGLFERRRRFECGVEVVVYPRVSPVRLNVLEQTGGAAVAPRVATGDGGEYFSVREYLPGDEIRHIVWRISARLGKWMVREMSQDAGRYVMIALDTRLPLSAENPGEQFEEAVELAASLAVTLLNRQYNVGLLTPEGHVDGGEGSGQQRLILEMLARAEPAMDAATVDFEDTLRKASANPVRLLCISPDPVEWGRRVAAGRVPIIDPREVVRA